jgi:hypothetical protein
VRSQSRIPLANATARSFEKERRTVRVQSAFGCAPRRPASRVLPRSWHVALFLSAAVEHELEADASTGGMTRSCCVLHQTTRRWPGWKATRATRPLHHSPEPVELTPVTFPLMTHRRSCPLPARAAGLFATIAARCAGSSTTVFFAYDRVCRATSSSPSSNRSSPRGPRAQRGARAIERPASECCAAHPPGSLARLRSCAARDAQSADAPCSAVSSGHSWSCAGSCRAEPPWRAGRVAVTAAAAPVDRGSSA